MRPLEHPVPLLPQTNPLLVNCIVCHKSFLSFTFEGEREKNTMKASAMYILYYNKVFFLCCKVHYISEEYPNQLEHFGEATCSFSCFLHLSAVCGSGGFIPCLSGEHVMCCFHPFLFNAYTQYFSSHSVTSWFLIHYCFLRWRKMFSYKKQI